VRPAWWWDASYYGDDQRVWLHRRWTCTDAEMASLHLIALVITSESGEEALYALAYEPAECRMEFLD
jgi:hypothetical protein